MRSVAKTFQTLLLRLAALLRGGAAREERRIGRETRTLTSKKERLEGARRDNEDALEKLKDEIRTLESRALRVYDELQKATGASKNVVAQQLALIKRDLERRNGRLTILVRNLDLIGEAVARVEEMLAALKAGPVNEDEIDELSVYLEDVFDKLAAADEAGRELAEMRYAPVPVAEGERPARVGEGQPEAQAQAVVELSAEELQWVEDLKAARAESERQLEEEA